MTSDLICLILLRKWVRTLQKPKVYIYVDSLQGESQKHFALSFYFKISFYFKSALFQILLLLG